MNLFYNPVIATLGTMLLLFICFFIIYAIYDFFMQWNTNSGYNKMRDKIENMNVDKTIDRFMPLGVDSKRRNK